MDQVPCWDQKASDSMWNASCRASVSPFLLGFEWFGEKYWENCHKHLFISSSDLLRNKIRVERQSSASSKRNHQGSPQISLFWINCLDNTHGTYNCETTLWQLQRMPERLRWCCCSPCCCFSFLHIPRVTMEREVIPRSAVPGHGWSPCRHGRLFCFWLKDWCFQ